MIMWNILYIGSIYALYSILYFPSNLLLGWNTILNCCCSFTFHTHSIEPL
nr:MAG TPA: hypothetical protein [Caudoviricetes sp.]